MSQDKWDLRFLEIAEDVASWSKDSTKIGAVIVGDKNQIISQGYNGFPRDINDFAERISDRETKLKYTVHAEANCIYNAIYNGAKTNGSTIYVYGLPVCHECAKAIIQVGIKRVVMMYAPNEKWEESGKLSVAMFEECGVEYKFINKQ